MAGEIRQMMKLFVFPFLYFASAMPVVIGLIVVFTLEEHYIGYNTLYFNGDISAVASLLVIGGCSWALVRLEGLVRPTLGDHLRRCAFLYAFVIVLGALFAAEYARNLVLGRPMYEVPEVVGIWLVAGFAIFVDALVLLWKRRRYYRVNPGGGL